MGSEWRGVLTVRSERYETSCDFIPPDRMHFISGIPEPAASGASLPVRYIARAQKSTERLSHSTTRRAVHEAGAAAAVVLNAIRVDSSTPMRSSVSLSIEISTTKASAAVKTPISTRNASTSIGTVARPRDGHRQLSACWMCHAGLP